MIKRRLYVIIPCRDRLILTQKCIESLWENSKLFNEIHIYVLDNKSDLDTDRFKIFQQLLKEGKIQYYSYDTENTLFNCFGKSVVFQRWLDMMKIQKQVRDYKKLDKDFMTYYMLVDNDFIFGPNWDSYFISAADTVFYYNKDTHFIVKYPSGVSQRYLDLNKSKILRNNFNNREYKLHFCNMGGSSGLWFMTFPMLEKLKWNFYNFDQTFNVDKRHDTGTWSVIKKEKGPIDYVSIIESPKDERLIIHLGGAIGSLCNKLYQKQYNNDVKNKLRENEEILKNMNVYEIFEKYKEKFHSW